MRLPNPWIAVPVLLAALGGAVVGYFVTDASCSPDSCAPLAVGVATISALAAAGGVAVVLVLAAKSLAEWRDHADREIVTETTDPPSPPTC